MIGRLRQGIRALLAWVRPVDDQLAADTLSPPLFALFRTMRAGERQHSLNVLQTLRARGESDPSLLRAALLHDVGKTRASFWLWERAFVVIARNLMPRRAQQWGAAEPSGWRRPFVISQQHPAWGAEMAAEAGADPLCVDLIGRHQHKLILPPMTESDRLLAALQAADEAN